MVLKQLTATEQSYEVVYSTVYALPGKVGFCVPRIIEDPQYLESLQSLLVQQRWVSDRQVNRVTGLVDITYHKLEGMSDLDMRSHLATLIEKASQIPQPQTNTEADSAKHPSNGIQGKTVNTDDSSSLSQVNRVTSAAREDSANHLSNGSQSKVLTTTTNGSSFSKTLKTVEPEKVNYKIVHTIPGRVRFRVPRIAKDIEYARRLEKLLKSDPVVKSERVNSAAASIVINYDHLLATESKEKLIHTINQRLSHLTDLIEFAASDVGVKIHS